jgi:tetratricopeptide (TPR) repeat protein
MTFRVHPWITAMAASGLLLAGCSTASITQSRQPKSEVAKETSRKSSRNKPAAKETSDKQIQSQAHFGTAVFYDLNGKGELALEEYWKAAQADPTYQPVVAEVARRLIRAKKPDRAIELLKKAITYPEANGNLYALLGLAYGQAGRTADAIAANRTAIKKVPQSLAGYQNLAQLYLQTSKTNEAVQVLDEAAKQSSVEADFLVDLAELYSRYARLKTLDSAAFRQRTGKVLDRAAKLKPANPILLQRLGDGFFALDELAKAEKIYLRLLESFPDVPLLRAKLAEIYLRLDNKSKAAEQLEEIAKDDPTNSRTYSILGALALDQNNFTNAVQHFERALWLNPDFEQVYYDLAGAKLAVRKPEEALATLDKARSRFKLNFSLEFYTGVTHIALKKYSEAVKSLTSAEALANTSDSARLTHLFYFQIGSAHERAGDPQRAEKYFRKSLELLPDYADALNYLGYMWADSGVNLPEARAMIEKAVKLEPDNAAFLDSLAWVLFRLKQPKEALTWILKAIEHIDEPDATLFDHLGDIYASLKQMDHAREAWGKSLSVEANDQIRQKLESAQAAERSAR